jgi:glutaredoxin 3
VLVVAAELPILFTKTGCPYCTDVISFLDRNGVGYRLQDVSVDAAARAAMLQRSGQTKAPTLDWNGEILADFGVDELIPFLRSRNVKFEDS